MKKNLLFKIKNIFLATGLTLGMLNLACSGDKTINPIYNPLEKDKPYCTEYLRPGQYFNVGVNEGDSVQEYNIKFTQTCWAGPQNETHSSEDKACFSINDTEEKCIPENGKLYLVDGQSSYVPFINNGFGDISAENKLVLEWLIGADTPENQNDDRVKVSVWHVENNFEP